MRQTTELYSDKFSTSTVIRSRRALHCPAATPSRNGSSDLSCRGKTPAEHRGDHHARSNQRQRLDLLPAGKFESHRHPPGCTKTSHRLVTSSVIGLGIARTSSICSTTPRSTSKSLRSCSRSNRRVSASHPGNRWRGAGTPPTIRPTPLGYQGDPPEARSAPSRRTGSKQNREPELLTRGQIR